MNRIFLKVALMCLPIASIVISACQKNEEAYVKPINEENPEAAYAAYVKHIYESMIALKEQYPEGMEWTDDNPLGGYKFKGQPLVGYGCAAFAFILSDAAFDDLPATNHSDFDHLKVGDIIRFPTHSVIILAVHDIHITVAEGNYSRSIHWGREIAIEEVKSHGEYIQTRYHDWYYQKYYGSVLR